METATSVIQGRHINPDDITFIRSLIKEHPGWHRTRLSREICQAWDWTNEAGRLKDMAARSLLRKLDAAGLIELPARVQLAHNHLRFREGGERPDYQAITGCLADLRPVRIVPADSGPRAKLFRGLLSHYHYLGYSGPVGENLRYLVYGARGRVLGCLMFGAAAWRIAGRDAFIGWDDGARARGLSRIAGNTRFLILPKVRVAHLASHVLAAAVRRVSADWQEKYGHPIYLLETFIEKRRLRDVA